MALTLSALPLYAPSAEAATAPAAAAPALTEDETAAMAIAAEMKRDAGQQGAVRAAARHFADKLESHHYPASPGDGIADGAMVAKAINGSLAGYQKVVPDYRMDEKVSVEGPIVTITSFTSGTYSGGGRFEDVSLVSYQVKGGQIVRADAVHTNPGAIQKAMRGNDDRATADHQLAETIAAEMRASHGGGLQVAAKYLSERVAVWSPEGKGAVRPAEALRAAISGEQATVQKRLSGYANTDDIKVEGNRVILNSKFTGVLADGRTTWADTRAALCVSQDRVVGMEVSHSPEAMTNLKAIFAAKDRL